MSSDRSGIDVQNAAALSRDYFAHGCIVGSPIEEPGPAISRNAVFDAARRFSKFLRILGRAQLVGYEVNEDQKSVLWFRRRSLQTGADLFDGIADAICTEAPPRGWTNEWLLSIHLKAYSPHDDNVFAVANIGEEYSLWNRCTWFSPEIADDDYYLWHVSYGAKYVGGNIISEAPSGWTYGRLWDSYAGRDWLNQHPNAADPDKLFFKSCQIYKPDYEIESAVAVTEGGEELVAVTLQTRLQNTYGEVDGAPETIGRDMSAWSAATIGAEPYRTDESALRLYLIWVSDGTNVTHTIGDQSLHSAVHSAVDSVYGAIIPHFVFLQLLPLPHLDDNEVEDASDTPLWSDWWAQAELYLRAMAEGYVDEESTKTRNQCIPVGPDPLVEDDVECAADPTVCECGQSGYDLVDYTFEALCYQAFEGRWLTTLPSLETDYLAATDVREDAPQGFGPLPNTLPAAELFNQFASAIDLLTKARLMLPYSLQYNERVYADWKEIDPAAGSVECSSTGGCPGKMAWFGQGPPATTPITESGWTDATGVLGARVASGFDDFACGPTGQFWLVTDRIAFDFKFSLVDPEAQYAIPESWRDMLDTDVGTMFCVQTYQIVRQVDLEGTEACGIGMFDCGFDSVFPVNEFSCEFMKAGTIDPGPNPPASWHYASVNALNPLDRCTLGPGSVVWITPTLGRTLYLDVPYTDEVEEDDGE